MTSRGRGQETPRRAVSLVLGAAAAVVLAVATSLAVMPAGAQVDDIGGDDAAPTRPAVYGASSSAFSYQVFVDTIPSLIIPEALKPSGPFTAAVFDSAGRSDAFGTLFYPGRAATEGPSLLCQFGFPCAQFPLPSYPLSATASYPTAPDSVPTVNGVTTGDAGTSTVLGDAHAHADLDGATALATTTRALVGGALPAVALLGVGASNAESTIAFEGDVLVARAHSVLQDVSIGAGLLRIDAIEATSVSRSSASGVLENESHIEISGARLAGQPVTIDEQGIGLAGNALDGGLIGLLGQTLATVLEPAGGTARLVGTSDVRDAGSGASADAVGLLVEVEVDLSALAQANPLGVTGLRVTFLLGQAASSSRALGAVPDEPAPVATGTGAPVSGPSTVLVPGTPGTPGTPAVPAVLGGTAAALLRSTIIDRAIEGNGLVVLYLVLSLSAAGGALASRLRPLRLVVKR